MRGIIYKLTNADKVYYGSTTRDKIESRISQHRSVHNTCISRIFNGVFEYEILEELEFSNIRELKIKEAEYIRNNDCINIRIDCRTMKEYYKDNKEKIYTLNKEWIKNNKESYKKIQKKYYDKKGIERNKDKIICDCGYEYIKRNYKQHILTKKHINSILVI